MASTGHIIELLVQRNCEIITTVRSEDKAAQIREAHPDAKITVVLVPDIAQPDAFDEVVKYPGLDVVLHSKHHSSEQNRIS
jgi:saccharopine dehydrogenase-like NADP-dependent oxidoreductase